MIKRRILNIVFVLLSLALCCQLQAKPRTAAQMRQIALSVLNRASSLTGKNIQGASLKVISHTEEYTVIGRLNGAYAIVSNDDCMPELLGYSYDGYNADNTGLKWYLKNISAVCKAVEASQTQIKRLKPDPNKYPTSISPLVTCHWGQLSPYNRYTPNNYPTGCVATAMAQIMYYHKLPVKGTGSRTITFPYDNPNGRKLTADFGNTTYDWAHMKDNYSSGNYSSEEADAVAQLMYHCGIAVNMDYEASASGAYTVDAAVGLRKYFGYPSSVRVATRGGYSESEWMDLIFSNVSHSMPILYTGVDGRMGGHAFVLDGYDENGLVHINWGWNGDDDGFYDVSVLNPKQYSFVEDQDMVIGIKGGPSETVDTTVATSKGGELASLLGDAKSKITSLHVTGPINSTDIKTIREMAGKDSVGHTTTGVLSSLDLKNATIVAGGDPYYIEGNNRYVASDDVMPEFAFYGCEPLTYVAVPDNVNEIGDGAFGMCVNLDSISIMNGNGKKYIYDDGFLFNTDKSELISCLPFKSGRIELSDDVKSAHKYAFSGCVQVKDVSLPASLSKIGKEAFEYCYSIDEIHSLSRDVPDAGAEAFSGVDKSVCKLYVPSGTKARYAASSEWKDFIGSKISDGKEVYYDNIIEFGVTITARNSTRRYGDKNPRFGYKVDGNMPDGTPSLYCAADEKSAVGDYDIIITRGTINDSTVQFRNGVLKVRPARLNAYGDTITVYQGNEIPLLTISYEGFKNDETKAVLSEEPQATTTATSNSPVGDYEILVSGGKADNYEITCYPGVLHIINVVDGIKGIACDPNKKANQNYYNLLGQKVGIDYKGIVIVKGKKYMRR